MYFINIIVEEFGDGEGNITRAADNRFRQFAADMREAEVQEIIVRIVQIGNQWTDREAVVDTVYHGGSLFRQEIDNGQEGTAVHFVLPAYVADIFLSESQVDAEAAHNENHRVVLANQVAHFICLCVFSLFIHSCYF